jgi:hypothetical protein
VADITVTTVAGTVGFATNCFVCGTANNGFIPIVGDWNGDGSRSV